MVTTNSCLTNLDFRAIDYLLSSDEGEKMLGERSKEAYEEVMGRLKPILKYVTNERRTDARCFYVHFTTLFTQDSEDVVMDWNGNLGVWPKGTDNEPVEIREENFWKYLPFCALLNGLREMLVKAEERKRQDLQAIATRREFVESVLADFQK